MRTRRLTVAVASGAIALGAAGFVAYPAFADDTPGSPPAASTEPRGGDREDRISEALKNLVEDGTLTQEQSDKVAEELSDADLRGPHVNPRAGGPFGVALDEVAEVLGLSRAEVESGLADGKSVKELAEEQGKDVGAVVDALVAAASEKVDEAVDEGRISQENANEVKSHLEERITDVVENGLPKLPGKGGDGPRFFHRGGPGATDEQGSDQNDEDGGTPGSSESSFLGAA
ncbi:YckD family protein [Kineosporia babensis]|uniref:YckD family protein n=1 Tax=Kineosporia babensis TaxID=499548 RepID=A0A9X1NCQ3_9ACTN|nr:YckD family protein [Kineosporia babensis]MCD5311690.1 YckD family protein [Kineosporia babensis]